MLYLKTNLNVIVESDVELEGPFELLSSSNSEHVDLVKADKITEIKNKAGQVIESKYKGWKQRNMLAGTLEMVDKLANGIVLTTEEQAVKQQISLVWEWVQGIREQSDDMELAVNNLTDIEDIINYPVNYIED